MRSTTNKRLSPAITIDPNIPDFSKSPFVVKKVEKARAFIAKHGLPEDSRSKNGKSKKK